VSSTAVRLLGRAFPAGANTSATVARLVRATSVMSSVCAVKWGTAVEGVDAMGVAKATRCKSFFRRRAFGVRTFPITPGPPEGARSRTRRRRGRDSDELLVLLGRKIGFRVRRPVKCLPIASRGGSCRPAPRAATLGHNLSRKSARCAAMKRKRTDEMILRGARCFSDSGSTMSPRSRSGRCTNSRCEEACDKVLCRASVNTSVLL